MSAGDVRTFVVPGRVELVGKHVDYAGGRSLTCAVDRAITAIDAEVGALGSQGPTERELAETRQFLIGSVPRMLETNQSIATFLHTAEFFGLGLDFDRRLPTLLAAVTMDEVRAAATEVLRPDRASVAIAGPDAGYLGWRSDG